MAEPRAAPPRILLVDDHALVRRGLRDLLTDELPGATFAEAGTSAEALALVRAGGLHLVVLDLALPGRGGLDTLRDLAETAPEIPVLVLSAHAEEHYAIRALRGGAAGYVTKDVAPEELARAVTKALAGGKYVSAALAEKLAANLVTDTGKPLHEALSNRELEVLRLLAGGLAVKEIAARLSLSEKTISTYRVRILEKMNMKSNAELMRYALHVGLVE
jgi:DNA-binding NarL/FixJ family response regulator